MLDLPFKHKGWGDEHKKYEKKVVNTKKEKSLNGNDITGILLKKLKDIGFLTRTERNYSGVNDNPFDIIQYVIFCLPPIQFVGFHIFYFA